MTTASSSYAQHIRAIRDTELPDLNSQVYLDASGQPTVPRSVLKAVHERLLNGAMVSNPHSNSPSGRRTRDEIDQVRSYVCRELFGVSRAGGRVDIDAEMNQRRGARDPGWELVFSSGATASLQLVARCFNFEEHQGRFGFLEQSHSSLLGLRDIVTQERGDRGCAGADVLSEEEMEGWIRRQSTAEGVSLLALPLQCNATGRRYNRLVSRLLHVRDQLERASPGKRKVYILLDAASYLSPSSNLPLPDSATVSPDFICFSFLKILGYPSGLGGLLLARASAPVLLLGKRYFGGGTLNAVTARQPWSQPSREICKAMEDGTPDLFGIVSVRAAISALRSETLLGSWASASEYVDHLTECMWTTLSSLRHGDGSPLLEIYSSQPQRWVKEIFPTKGSGFHLAHLSQGAIVLFNVLRASSAAGGPCRVDPTEVDRLACVEDIHMRSGRMCNVGSVTKALGITEGDIQALWERGIGCDSYADTRTDEGSSDSGCHLSETDRLESMVSGCLRISLSAWNTTEDIEKVASFLDKHFVERFIPAESDEVTSSINEDIPAFSDEADVHDSDYYLKEVHLYPIKSCAFQSVKGEWQITSAGLQYDRQFCIVDLGNRKILSQKQVPKMACIRPQVCLEAGMLLVQLVDEVDDVQAEFSVPLQAKEMLDNEHTSSYDLCGRSMQPVLFPQAHIRHLLSDFLGRDCTLAQSAESQHWPREEDCVPLLYSNESPFLLIAQESVQQVCRWIKGDERMDLDEAKVAMAFRANFIVASRRSVVVGPFYEEAARRVQIGPHTFSVLGPCRRCQMVGLDQTNGHSLPQILRTVAKHCRCVKGRLKGRLLFGMHLSWKCQSDLDAGVMLRAGMPIQLFD